MKSWKLNALVIVSLLFGASCQKTQETAPSIYHWKSTFTLEDKDYQKLDSLGIERVYIRFFDVDIVEGKVRPKASLIWRQVPDTAYEWVPCLYITQKGIKAIGVNGAEDYAKKCLFKIDKIAAAVQLSYTEVQLDCDWTAATKSAFFAFCEAIQKLADEKNCRISSTIRLHQLRDIKAMGIPPVDRGMLMLYNNGDYQSVAETNSILNLKKASVYLNKADEYPLELDLALPLFSWAVWFRNGSFQGLKSAWTASELDTSKLLKQQQNGLYQCLQDGLFLDEYLLEGDVIRMEESSVDLNLEAIQLLGRHDFPKPKNISLYHYNPKELDAQSCQELAKIYHSWD